MPDDRTFIRIKLIGEQGEWHFHVPHFWERQKNGKLVKELDGVKYYKDTGWFDNGKSLDGKGTYFYADFDILPHICAFMRTIDRTLLELTMEFAATCEQTKYCVEMAGKLPSLKQRFGL